MKIHQRPFLFLALVLTALSCRTRSPAPSVPQTRGFLSTSLSRSGTGTGRAALASLLPSTNQPFPRLMRIDFTNIRTGTNLTTPNYLTWHLLSSTNLRDWQIEQYHIELRLTNVVVTNNGEPYKFFKAIGL